MEKEKRSFWSRFQKGASQETKAFRNAAMFAYQTVGDPVFSENFFDAQVSSGYLKNAVVYRCVTLIARNISAVPLVLYENDQRVHTHPVLDLLKQPNGMQNYASFCEAVITYLLLAGDSFIQAFCHAGHTDPISELHVLRPDRTHVVPGNHGYPKAYDHVVGNRKSTFTVHPETEKCPILHIKLFNPLDRYRGVSPMWSAKSMIDLQNVIVGHNLALLQNAGCPSGALMVKGAQLTETQKNDLREQLKSMKARGGAGSMMLLDGQFEWKEMGLSPKDMDFTEGRTMAAREIAQVFGVPPMCIGILGDSTYSNYQEARLHLWEDTLLPHLDMFLSHLNHWLLPYYGENLTLSYNKDDIHALIPRREKMWEKVCKISCLTINEKRKILGYPALTGGDTLAEGSERNAVLEESAR